DLDILDVEGVARVAAAVARAVDEDVAARVEATELEIVGAGGETVFARVEGNAGGVPQDFGQVARALLLDDLLRNDVHRLRRVEERRGLLRGGKMIGRVGIGSPLNLERRRHDGVSGLLFIRRDRFLGGGRDRGEGGERYGNACGKRKARSG